MPSRYLYEMQRWRGGGDVGSGGSLPASWPTISGRCSSAYLAELGDITKGLVLTNQIKSKSKRPISPDIAHVMMFALTLFRSPDWALYEPCWVKEHHLARKTIIEKDHLKNASVRS
jgi:hypothetical protein